LPFLFLFVCLLFGKFCIFYQMAEYQQLNEPIAVDNTPLHRARSGSVDGPPDDNAESSHFHCSVLGRHKRLSVVVGVLLLAAIAVAVAVTQTQSDNHGPSMAQDNAQTKKLYQQWNDAAASNKMLTYNAELVGPEASEVLKKTLKQDSLSVRIKSVSLSGDSTKERVHIVATGMTDDFVRKGTRAELTSSVQFIGGQPHLTMHALVHQQEHQQQRQQHPQEQSVVPTTQKSVPVSSALPQGEMPSAFDSLYMLASSYSFSCSPNGTDPITGKPLPQGLSMTAVLDLDDAHNTPAPTSGGNPSAHPAPLFTQGLNLYRSVYKEQVNSLPGEIAQRFINITGALRPHIRLSYTTAPDKEFRFGNRVVVKNFTVEINPSKQTVASSAAMIVLVSNNLTVEMQGTVNLKTHHVFLSGSQVGDWVLPAHGLHGLSLEHAAANITFDYDSDKKVIAHASGNVTAGVQYGNLHAMLGIKLPTPKPAPIKGVPNMAIEAEVTDSFSFGALPVSNAAAVPNLSIVKAAFVFSPYAGTYTFMGDEAPVASTPVVKGFNLVAKADIPHSAPLSALPVGSQTTVDLHGSVTTSGVFHLQGDLASLDIGKDFQFKTANLSVSNRAPYLELDADMLVAGHVLGSDKDVDFTVSSGVQGGGDFDVAGTANAAWDFHVGSEPVNITNAKIAVKHAKGAKPPTSAHVSTEFSVGKTYQSEWKLALDYPKPDAQADQVCFSASVDEVSSPFSVAQLISMLLPSHPSPEKLFKDVPTHVLQEVLNTTLGDIDLLVSPGCGNVTLSASMHTELFGNARLGASFYRNCTQQPNTKCGDWQFHVWIIPAEDWKISSSSLMGDDWPRELAIKMPLFVLSSSKAWIFIPFGDDDAPMQGNISIETNGGLQVRAQVVINREQAKHSDAMPVYLFQAMSDPKDVAFQFAGDFSKTEWSAWINLNQETPVDMGHHITLGAASIGVTTVLSPKPVRTHFNFSTELRAPNPSNSSETMVFNVSGEVFSDHVSLSGGMQNVVESATNELQSDPCLSMHVGHWLSMCLERVHVDVALHLPSGSSNATVLSGDLSGVTTIGPSHLTSQFDLLVSSDHHDSFKLVLSERPPLPLSALVQHFSGTDIVAGMHLPSSMRENALDFVSLSLTIQTSPASISGAGAMTLFNVADLSSVVSLYHTDDVSTHNGWGFTFGVELGLNTSVTQLLPHASSDLENMNMASLAVAISSTADSINFPQFSTPFKVSPGFNLFARATFPDTQAFRTIRKWTGITTAEVRAVIESEDEFELHADAEGDLKLLHRIDVTAAGLVLQVTPTDVKIGVESDASVNVTRRPQDSLSFHGDFMVATQGLAFDVAMTKDWVNPLGVRGVRISRAALSAELSWALVPVQLGIAGGLHIGSVGGDGAVWLSEEAEMVYGELDNIHLNQIIDAMMKGVGINSPPHLVNVITNVGFEKLVLYANTGVAAVVFNGHSYAPGYLFSIQQLNLWDVIKGSATLALSDTNLRLNATLQPIHLCHNAIVLSGAESANDPAKLLLELSAHSIKDAVVNISAGITMFGQHLATEVVISDTQFKLLVDTSLFDNLYHFHLECEAQGTVSNPTDFAVSAVVNNELQDWIAEEVPKRLAASKSEVDSKFDAARADVNAKIADLNAISEKIDKIKDEDEQKLDKEKAKLMKAQADVQHHKQHVEQISDHIAEIKEKIHKLKWYQKWKAVGYYAEIGALETAKGVALAALDVANAALKAIEKIVGKLDDVDPRVIALEVERGTKHAALDAAKAVLSGLEHVYNGLEHMASMVAKWQAKAFNIETLSLSGSLTKLEHGDLLDVHLVGKFAGVDVQFTVSADLHLAVTFVDSIWHHLLKIFSDK
jgi:hypothetical protein